MTLAETSNGSRPGMVSLPENERGTRHINVGDRERLISIVVGIPVTIFGLTRGLGGLIPAALGGLLIFRGVTGHSFLYQLLGVNTLGKSPAAMYELPGGQGIQVKRAVTVLRSPQDLYSQWHDFESAPVYVERGVGREDGRQSLALDSEGAAGDNGSMGSRDHERRAGKFDRLAHAAGDVFRAERGISTLRAEAQRKRDRGTA